MFMIEASKPHLVGDIATVGLAVGVAVEGVRGLVNSNVHLAMLDTRLAVDGHRGRGCELPVASWEFWAAHSAVGTGKLGLTVAPDSAAGS